MTVSRYLISAVLLWCCLHVCIAFHHHGMHHPLPSAIRRMNNLRISSQTEDSSSGDISGTRLRGEPKLRSKEWAALRGLTPGYGGYWPGDPNAKKHKVTIKSGNKSYTLDVPEDRYIFFYFEEEGVDLPIINKPRMCRQGCCTICTVKVTEGQVESDTPLGLLKEFRKEGYALSCCSYPRSDMVCELQTEDEVYVKQWGESFEGGGVQWGGVLPEDD